MKKIISFALVCVMLLGCVFALASCGKSYTTPDEAKAALEEAGYTVYVNESKTYLYANFNNVNKKAYDEIHIYYYDSESAAQAAWTVKSAEYEKQVSEQDEEYKYEYAIDGSVIYYGTKEAVKTIK